MRVLILGDPGTGKTTSLGMNESLGIKGLSPDKTFIITTTKKPLSFPDSTKLYKICDPTQTPTKENGNRFISNDGDIIAKVMLFVAANRPDIKNIVIDDLNYIMQDLYMKQAEKKGFEVFKMIGSKMNAIFDAENKISDNMNIIMLAHCEEFKDSNFDTISFRMKTVGKMVRDYIVPEGKFEIVLFIKQSFDNDKKEVTKQFVTNYDGQYPAKSPAGMFKDLYIKNDMQLVLQTASQYYNKNTQ
jgi:hypothetical protein